MADIVSTKWSQKYDVASVFHLMASHVTIECSLMVMFLTKFDSLMIEQMKFCDNFLKSLALLLVQWCTKQSGLRTTASKYDIVM